MKPLRYRVNAKNLLIGAGAYFLSWWLAGPLAFGYGKLTHRIPYSGDFGAAVVLPLVIHLPVALVAAGVGATVVWLVESRRPIAWAIFPSLLYALFGFVGYHWVQPPLLLDRVQQTTGAIFPALACIIGGILAAKRRATPPAAPITPG